MTELLKELGQAPKDGEDPQEIEEMRQAWEKMLISGMDAGGADGVNLPGVFGGTPPTAGPAPPPPKAKDVSADSKSGSSSKPDGNDFQKTIRQAMEKLKDSEEALKVCGTCDL